MNVGQPGHRTHTPHMQLDSQAQGTKQLLLAVPHCAMRHTGLAGSPVSLVLPMSQGTRHRAAVVRAHIPATAAAAQLGQGQESSSSLPAIPQRGHRHGVGNTAVAGGSGKAGSGTGCLCLSMFMGNRERLRNGGISGLSQLVKHLG